MSCCAGTECNEADCPKVCDDLCLSVCLQRGSFERPTSIAVPNSSFEVPLLEPAPASAPIAAAVPWTDGGGGGAALVANVGQAATGQNCAAVDVGDAANSVVQDLADATYECAQYVLTVAVAGRLGQFPTPAGASVALALATPSGAPLASTVVSASDLAVDGAFRDFSVTATLSAQSAALGEPIRIALGVQTVGDAGGEVLFDNVRLRALPCRVACYSLTLTAKNCTGVPIAQVRPQLRFRLFDPDMTAATSASAAQHLRACDIGDLHINASVGVGNASWNGASDTSLLAAPITLLPGCAQWQVYFCCAADHVGDEASVIGSFALGGCARCANGRQTLRVRKCVPLPAAAAGADCCAPCPDY